MVLCTQMRNKQSSIHLRNSIIPNDICELDSVYRKAHKNF